MAETRNITIDLNHKPDCKRAVFAGYEGEHNSTTITLIVPSGYYMKGYSHNAQVENSFGELIETTPLTLTASKSGGYTTSFKLTQNMTTKGCLKVQFCVRDSNGNFVRKSDIYPLVILDSVSGVPDDPDDLAYDPTWLEYLKNITMNYEGAPDTVLISADKTGAPKQASYSYSIRFMKGNTNVTDDLTSFFLGEGSGTNFTGSLVKDTSGTEAKLVFTITPKTTLSKTVAPSTVKINCALDGNAYTHYVSIQYAFDGEDGGTVGSTKQIQYFATDYDTTSNCYTISPAHTHSEFWGGIFNIRVGATNASAGINLKFSNAGSTFPMYMYNVNHTLTSSIPSGAVKSGDVLTVLCLPSGTQNDTTLIWLNPTQSAFNYTFCDMLNIYPASLSNNVITVTSSTWSSGGSTRVTAIKPSSTNTEGALSITATGASNSRPIVAYVGSAAIESFPAGVVKTNVPMFIAVVSGKVVWLNYSGVVAGIKCAETPLSVADDGTVNIPKAYTGVYGVVKAISQNDKGYGVYVDGNTGYLKVDNSVVRKLNKVTTLPPVLVVGNHYKISATEAITLKLPDTATDGDEIVVEYYNAGTSGFTAQWCTESSTTSSLPILSNNMGTGGNTTCAAGVLHRGTAVWSGNANKWILDLEFFSNKSK